MFRISNTIRRTETVDGGILLDVLHGQMFCLNVVGSKILELMQRGYDETRITDEISHQLYHEISTLAEVTTAVVPYSADGKQTFWRESAHHRGETTQAGEKQSAS